MITVTCECGSKLRVKDELAGKKGKCPKCGRILTLAEQDLKIIDTAATQDTAQPSGRDKKVCPGCGARIPSLSFSCEFCGATLGETNRPSANISSFESENIPKSAGDRLDKEVSAVLRDIDNLPDSPDGLVSMFSKYIEGAGVDGHPNIQKAQACRAALTKLKAFSAKDPRLISLVIDLQSQYNERMRRSKRTTILALIGILLILLLGGGVAISISIHNGAVLRDVNRLISEGNFAEARIRAQEVLNYENEERKELLSTIDKAERSWVPKEQNQDK